MKAKLASLMIAAGIAASGLFVASPASASIIFNSSISAVAQGFGAKPRLLTVQTGLTATESACDSNVGGVLSQTCSGADATFQGNGTIDAGGNDVSVANKNSLANLSSYGITDATQIILIYNPSQQ